MIDSSHVERAHHLSRKRALLVGITGVLFGVLSVALWPRYADPVDGRALFALWVVYALAALLLIFTGGAIFIRHRVRALMNDEITLAHRRRAISIGFGASALTAVVILVVPSLSTLAPRAASYSILSAGIVAALCSFAYFEITAVYAE